MGYCIATFTEIYKILQKSFRANSPRFGLAIRELPSDFQTYLFSFSNYSVLLSRLIYRCFITIFATRIFDYDFEIFCSCKFISCVLKSGYILWNIQY